MTGHHPGKASKQPRLSVRSAPAVQPAGPSNTAAQPDADVSLGIRDPNQLTPGMVQRMQTTHGNQFVQRLIESKRRASAHGPTPLERTAADAFRALDAPANAPTNPRRTIQRLTTSKQLNSQIKWHQGMKGKTRKRMDTYLDAYHKNLSEINALTKKNQLDTIPATRMQALDNLLVVQELARQWVDEHSGETLYAQRLQVISDFKNEVDQEVLVLQGTVKNDVRERMGGDPDQAVPEGTFTTNEVVKKMQKKYEGDTDSMFTTVLRPMYDALVPTIGEGRGEVEFRIPVESTGTAFVGGRLATKVERYKPEGADAVKAEIEVMLTAGGNLATFAELKGEIGKYMEAKAASTTEVTKLLSFGLYRELRESRFFPNVLVNAMWGGSFADAGYKKSEKWAANVEKEIFGSDKDSKKYVMTGVQAGLEGKVGYKAGGLSSNATGKLKARALTRYNKKSIEKREGALGVTHDSSEGRRQKSKGEGIAYYVASGSTKLGPFGCGVEFKLMRTDSYNQERETAREKLEELTEAGIDVKQYIADKKLAFKDLEGEQDPLVLQALEKQKKDIAQIEKYLAADSALLGAEYIKFMVDGRASLPISTIFSPEATIALLATLAGNLASLKPIFEENMKKGMTKDKAKSENNLAKTIGAAEGAGVSLSVGISQIASSLTNPSAIKSFVSQSPVTDALKPKSMIDASAGFGIQVIYERSGSNPGVFKFRLNLEQSMTGLIKGLDVQVFRAVAEQFNNLIALEGPNVIYVNPILRPIFMAVSKLKEKGTNKGLFKGKK